MELHPQMRALLARLEAAGYPDQTRVPVDQARRITDQRAARFYGEPETVARVAEITIPGPAGALAARVYHPEDAGGQGDRAGLPVMVYFHGGGWVLGSLDSHDRGVRALVNAGRCLGVSVAYRLAPEHPFPAALEDGVAALGWIADHAAALGGDPGRLAVAGDSAGGNLAAVTALMARDQGGPALAHQVLIYPVVDSDLKRASYQAHWEAPMLPGHRMAYFWDQYVPDAGRRGDWRVAPLRAPSHRGLPPATIIAAGIDPLCGEGAAYAEALAGAGVPAAYHLFPGMTHAFFQAPALLDDARAAVDIAGAALQKSFAVGNAA